MGKKKLYDSSAEVLNQRGRHLAVVQAGLTDPDYRRFGSGDKTDLIPRHTGLAGIDYLDPFVG